MNRESASGQALFLSVAGIGVLTFALGPAISLLSGLDPLIAATIGYAGIALFAGGIAARYSFAVASRPLVQLLKNLAFAIVVSSVFYVMFLLLYLL